MKFAKILSASLTFCMFVSTSVGVEQIFPSRDAQRVTNNDKNSSRLKSPRSLPEANVLTKLESIATVLQEKIEKFQKFEERIERVLKSLDDKLVKVDAKLLNYEKLLNATKNDEITSARLASFETKINNFDSKLDNLIHHFDKPDAGPQHFVLNKNSGSNDFELVSQQIKDSLESFGEKIRRNLSENGEKLEYLKSYLHVVFDQNENKNMNISHTDELQKQTQRRERRISGTMINDGLINEILSMVKDRLKTQEEDDAKKIAETTSSFTDIISSFERMKATTAAQKNISIITSTLRRDRLIFPNAKNKPAKLNNTFISNSTVIKDFKVGEHG